MSCNLRDERKSQESGSQAPEGGDYCGGSDDHPTGHGHAVEAAVRTPLQEVSRSSDSPLPVSQAKGKRKLLDVGSSTASAEAKAGPAFTRKALRKRLTFTEKIEILQLLKGNRLKQMAIARQYGCSRSAISKIARERTELETKKKSPGFNGQAKSDKSSELPQVEERVVQMVTDARRQRIPVSRDVISSFGRAVKNQILSSGGLSDGERKRLEKFSASARWAENFVRRQGLVSKALHGETGGADRQAAKEGMDFIRYVAENYGLNSISNVDETGLLYKVLPRRTYLAEFEERKTARGSKDMGAKNQVSVDDCGETADEEEQQKEEEEKEGETV